MKNTYFWKFSLLLWISLVFGIPGVAQKNLVLDMYQGNTLLRSSKTKMVSRIREVTERYEHSATFGYDSYGNIQRLTIDGQIGHIKWDADLYYERSDSELLVYEVSGTNKTLRRICKLNKMGYIVHEKDPSGDNVYTYSYNDQGETISGMFDGEPVQYIWKDGNLSQFMGQYFTEQEYYTDYPNLCNIRINSLYREPYWEDYYGLALCGYIGNNDVNLSYKTDAGKAIFDYIFDQDGYPTQINVMFDGQPQTILIEYDESFVPDPTPDDPTTEDELGEIIDNAPAGTEDEPTEVFIPGSGITIHKPVDIDGYKHIRLTGGPLLRGEDNPYALLRIRPGSSLELKGVLIDGKNVDLKDGSLIVYGVLRLSEGTVISNCIRTTPNTPSGAICVAPEGVLIMEGGTISDNVGSYGSAVYNEGTFLLKGGAIQDNKAQIGSIVNNEQGKFVMTGGEVKYNEASEGCGGVFNSDITSFSMTGGVITHNEDCEIYSWTHLQIGGSAYVDGLTLLNTGNKLLIRPSLQNNWRIAYVDRPAVGTIIAEGYGSYQLSNSDCRKISYDKNTCILEQSGNTIVVAGITANEEIAMEQITWCVYGNQLHLKGLKSCSSYCVYTIDGRLVTQLISDVYGQSMVTLSSGVYLVSNQEQTIKIRIE